MKTTGSMAGGEIREAVRETDPGYRLYGYDPQLLLGTNYFDFTARYPTRPYSTGMFPQPDEKKEKYTDRYLSYFANASYTYRQRYILSSSVRWDGSNLYGVKTNQKGTPLWSIGGSWELDKEHFFSLPQIEYLRLRATYGSAGNTNRSVSAFPVIYHAGTDSQTKLGSAIVQSIGNPSLKWEKVETWNLGLDWRLRKGHFGGSVDYYVKKSTDLIGEDILSPSTGVFPNGSASRSNLVNYADMLTRGIDIQLNTAMSYNSIQWNTALLISFVKNRITRYKDNPSLQLSNYLGSRPVPTEGKSRDALYAIPWYGLDRETGYLNMYVQGEKTDSYEQFYKSLGLTDLVYAGVTVPTAFGSLRNDLSWRNFSFSILLTGKFGHVFRRSSIASGGQLSPLNYHMDYLKRWQKPGDEQWTDVPARSDRAEYYDDVYTESEILVTSGDHIRLQDIRLSYNVGNALQKLKAGKIKVNVFAYARNLGIIWKSNKLGIDPDFANSEYVLPKTFSLGINVVY